MNKRIKDIAEKAGLRFTQLMSNPMVPVVDGKETDLEKFAELLVRECMKVADEGMAQVTMKVEWPSYHIKKHFGVEE